MEYVVKGRRPASVFRFFEEISAIPRGSYNERGVADYLENFARERGLSCYRDAHENVLIKIPATAGLESVPPILFQGHTDMVCEKNADVEHDFLRDPLKLYVDETGFLRAKGTTLGADNGIAVAMMLALLDGEIAEHPAMECLFTTAEEVGLNGAHGFDYSKITARRMVNMDSEALGVITAGCAGGIRSDLCHTLHPEPFAGDALRVSIRGLMGGHSGENIKDGRANANKLMGRLLAALGDLDFRIVSITGGSKDNAIPRECEAILACADAEAVCDRLTDLGAEIARELSRDDRAFTLTCEDSEPESVMSSREDTQRLTALLAASANGVQEMSRDVAGLVEYSRNLGVVRTEGDAVHIVFSSRSSMESRLDASVRELDALAAITGCSANHHSRYPGWEFSPQSALREAYAEAYRAVTGEDVIVNVIHAGLECGIIYSKLPDMDIISVGPTMHDIHSPNEALDLGATEVFWTTVERLIENLSRK